MGHLCSCLDNQANGKSTFLFPEDIPVQNDPNVKSPVVLNRYFLNAMSVKNGGLPEVVQDGGPTNENKIIQPPPLIMKNDQEFLEREKQKEKELEEQEKEKLKEKEREQEKVKKKLYLKQKIGRYAVGHLFRKKFKKSLRKELEVYRDKLYEEWTNMTKNENVRKIESNPITPPYDLLGWKKYYTRNDFQPEFKGKLFDRGILFTYDTDNRNDMTPKQLLEIATAAYKGQVSIDNSYQGYGTLIEKSGAKYVGFWTNNNFIGWGRYINDNGTLFQGVFLNGVLNGKGCEIAIEGYSYFGDFVKGQRHGEGVEETVEMTYKGSFLNDKRQGKGEMILKTTGDTYKGDFENHMFHGRGVYIWKKNGHEYDGQYFKGIMHGFGTYKWNDKEYYKGEYVNGIKEGNGEFMWDDGKKYVGQFKSGMPHGIGYIEKDGKKEDVEFIEGKINKQYHPKRSRELIPGKIKN